GVSRDPDRRGAPAAAHLVLGQPFPVAALGVPRNHSTHLQERNVQRLISIPRLASLLAALLFAGCARPAAHPAGPPPDPEVEVSLPLTAPVTDYEDFPGRTEAVDTIDVRARVTGYL